MENTSGSEVRKRRVEEDQEKAGKEEKEYEGAEWRLRGWSLQLLSDGKGYSYKQPSIFVDPRGTGVFQEEDKGEDGCDLSPI